MAKTKKQETRASTLLRAVSLIYFLPPLPPFFVSLYLCPAQQRVVVVRRRCWLLLPVPGQQTAAACVVTTHSPLFSPSSWISLALYETARTTRGMRAAPEGSWHRAQSGISSRGGPAGVVVPGTRWHVSSPKVCSVGDTCASATGKKWSVYYTCSISPCSSAGHFGARRRVHCRLEMTSPRRHATVKLVVALFCLNPTFKVRYKRR